MEVRRSQAADLPEQLPGRDVAARVLRKLGDQLTQRTVDEVDPRVPGDTVKRGQQQGRQRTALKQGAGIAAVTVVFRQQLAVAHRQQRPRAVDGGKSGQGACLAGVGHDGRSCIAGATTDGAPAARDAVRPGLPRAMPAPGPLPERPVGRQYGHAA